MEFLLLLALILLNGIFAMSEIAIVTAKKTRLLVIQSQGNKSATRALDLADNPNRFLSTVQVGITSIGILSGIFGESALADPLSEWLETLGMNVNTSSMVSTLLVVVMITFLSIVIGELVPKRIGQLSAEKIACLVAKPMFWLSRLASPVVFILTSSTSLVMQILGISSKQEDSVTEEEIQALLHEGSKTGAIDDHEHQILKNVLRLSDRPIRSIMVPRAEVVYLDTNLTLEANMQRIAKSAYSVLPLCTDNLDKVVGVVKSKDILSKIIQGEDVNLAELAVEGKFVMDNLNALDLLEYFKSSSDDMMFILDENDSVPGIVTLHDLIEAISGEMNEESEDPSFITQDDGSYLIDGSISVLDLNDYLEIPQHLLEDQFYTLNGLFMKMLDRVPVSGDKITLPAYELEVVEMIGLRVSKVLAVPIAPPVTQDAPETPAE